MGLLHSFLLDRKYFEALDEVEQFLADNDLPRDAVIQRLIFSKDAFEEDEARAWAQEHGFESVDPEESGDSYVIEQHDLSEFVDDSLRTVEIAKGVQAAAGMLKMLALDPTFLSLRNEEEAGITFSDNLPHTIELAKVVSGHHVVFGPVEITTEMLESFERNFRENAVGVDLMIDYDHDQREAAGWIKDVYLSTDKQTLYGVVRWTPEGARTLADRKFRYFSPEFSLNYVHPHSGRSHGPTLLGGGLVNRPFLKMDAIVSFKEQTNNREEKTMDTISLTEHKSKVADLEKQISDLKLSEEKGKNKVGELEAETAKLSEEIKEFKAKQAKKEMEDKHAKLFAEGKISAAQQTALNEGKDLYEVLAMNTELNTKPAGEDAGEGNTKVKLSEQEKAACKLLNLSEDDYIKYNKEA